MGKNRVKLKIRNGIYIHLTCQKDIAFRQEEVVSFYIRIKLFTLDVGRKHMADRPALSKSLEAYYHILEEKRKGKTAIDKQFEYNLISVTFLKTIEDEH